MLKAECATIACFVPLVRVARFG